MTLQSLTQVYQNQNKNFTTLYTSLHNFTQLYTRFNTNFTTLHTTLDNFTLHNFRLHRKLQHFTNLYKTNPTTLYTTLQIFTCLYTILQELINFTSSFTRLDKT